MGIDGLQLLNYSWQGPTLTVVRLPRESKNSRWASRTCVHMPSWASIDLDFFPLCFSSYFCHSLGPAAVCCFFIHVLLLPIGRSRLECLCRRANVRQFSHVRPPTMAENVRGRARNETEKRKRKFLPLWKDIYLQSGVLKYIIYKSIVEK